MAHQTQPAFVFVLAVVVVSSFVVGSSFFVSWLFSESFHGNDWDLSTRQTRSLELFSRSIFNPHSLFNERGSSPIDFMSIGDNESFILFDGHTHTLASDGRMSVSQLLQWTTNYGMYDAIAITDHNTFDGGICGRKLARNDANLPIVVFAGMEYSSCAAHMNILVPPSISDNVMQAFEKQERAAPLGALTISRPTVSELVAFVGRIHTKLPGSLVIVNHVSWSTKYERPGSVEKTLPDHPTIEQFVSTIKVDGFEVINGATLETLLLSSPIVNTSLLLLSGSDIHYPISPTCWTILIPDPIDREKGRETMIWNALVRSKERPLLSLHPEGLASVPRASTFDPSWRNLFSPLSAISTAFRSTFIAIDSGMYSFINGERCHQCEVSVCWICIPMFIFMILLFSLLLFALNAFLKKRLLNPKVSRLGKVQGASFV